MKWVEQVRAWLWDPGIWGKHHQASELLEVSRQVCRFGLGSQGFFDSFFLLEMDFQLLSDAVG